MTTYLKVTNSDGQMQHVSYYAVSSVSTLVPVDAASAEAELKLNSGSRLLSVDLSKATNDTPPEAVAVSLSQTNNTKYMAVWAYNKPTKTWIRSMVGELPSRDVLAVRIPAPQSGNAIAVLQYLEHVDHPGYKIKCKLVEESVALTQDHRVNVDNLKVYLTKEDEQNLRHFTALEASTYLGTNDEPKRPATLFGYPVVYDADITGVRQ